MNKIRDIFFLGIKLSFPFSDNREEAFLEYIEYIENEASFVPFIVFKAIYDYLNSGLINYSRNILNNKLNDIEQRLFIRFYRNINYIFNYFKENKIIINKNDINILINFFIDEISFWDIKVLKLKIEEIPLSGEIFSLVELFNVSELTYKETKEYFDNWENAIIYRNFLKELSLEYSLNRKTLSLISKKLIFSIEKFLNIVGDIESYNFHLRKILGRIIKKHSNYKYPTGGYSEISKGNDEPDKVLSSELIYLDENMKGIDLFIVKYIENDLLFMIRDDNEFYGSVISFIFDLSYVKLFLKDKGEFIPEYYLILVFIISIVRIVRKEISDIRTYFLLKNVPKSINEIVRYFIPEGIDYEKAASGKKIPTGVKIYTVFNGDFKKDVESHIKIKVGIDIDMFNIEKNKIRLFDKRDVGKTLKKSGDIIRAQIKNNYIRAINLYLKGLE
jgi:hypothetical protein